MATRHERKDGERDKSRRGGTEEGDTNDRRKEVRERRLNGNRDGTEQGNWNGKREGTGVGDRLPVTGEKGLERMVRSGRDKEPPRRGSSCGWKSVEKGDMGRKIGEEKTKWSN